MARLAKFKTTALTSLGSAIILSLAAPAALAQPDDGDDSRRPAWSQGRQHGNEQRSEARARSERQTSAENWRNNRPTYRMTERTERPTAERSAPVVRASRYDDDRPGRDNWRQSPNHAPRWSTRDDRRWDRNWRNDARYDWREYRNYHRQIYRLSPYRAPYRHYGYHRLRIGFVLRSLFFGQDYWLEDPWQYRLPPAYGPYRWVRYYDDALLVNLHSGEVVDVTYELFW